MGGSSGGMLRSVSGISVIVLMALPLVGCGTESTKETGTSMDSEHAVIVHVVPGWEPDAVYDLEDRLTAALDAADAGEVDGHEFALDGSETVIYVYGSDADSTWEAMRPVLVDASLPSESYAVKRYGDADDPDAREERVAVG